MSHIIWLDPNLETFENKAYINQLETFYFQKLNFLVILASGILVMLIIWLICSIILNLMVISVNGMSAM